MVGASGVEPWVPKGFYDGYTSRAGHWYRGRRVDRRNWRVGSHRSSIGERGGEGVKGQGAFVMLRCERLNQKNAAPPFHLMTPLLHRANQPTCHAAGHQPGQGLGLEFGLQ